MQLPRIIQGGMGVGISNWRLANAVSRTGQLGVVSGTALDQVLTRRLQDGDPGGHMRRGLDAFPMRKMAERVWEKYYIPGGKPPQQSYIDLPMHALHNTRELVELCIVANFVEVFLAREAQMSYCTLAVVTDYDCWLEDPEQHVSVDKVMALYSSSIERVQSLLKKVFVKPFNEDEPPCRHSLVGAIVTPQIPESKQETGFTIY